MIEFIEEKYEIPYAKYKSWFEQSRLQNGECALKFFSGWTTSATNRFDPVLGFFRILCPQNHVIHSVSKLDGNLDDWKLWISHICLSFSFSKYFSSPSFSSISLRRIHVSFVISS